MIELYGEANEPANTIAIIVGDSSNNVMSLTTSDIT